MKQIVWVTPEYFLETDIYVVPELTKYYNICWIIEHFKDVEKIPFYSDLEKCAVCDNLNIEYIHRPAAHPLSYKFWHFYWKLISKIKSYKPFTIYSAVLGIPYIPFCILRIPRKKIVFAAHNVNTPKGVKHYTFTKLYMGLTWRWFINFQNFSMSQYELLRNTYGEKNNFYAPFVLKDYGKSFNQPKDIITFLSFGRIRGYKSIEVLIEAAQRVKEQNESPFKVIIAGECSDWDSYQKLIRYPEFFDLRIHEVENADIPKLFGESHYTVLPYQDIAQSGALFVCINYCKPSILSQLPAFTEYITDGVDGLMIRPANIEDLTKQMLYVLNNHETVYPILKANLEKMKYEKFDKDAIVMKYKDYFDSFMQYANIS